MNAACSAGRSAANEAWNWSRETGDERADRLPLVRREGADVDQGRDVRVGAGLGDDRAAVGVADEHDRSVLGIDDLPGSLGVAFE
jgi:hypothetical protein